MQLMRISSMDLTLKSLSKRVFAPGGTRVFQPLLLASTPTLRLTISSVPIKARPRPPFLPFTGGHVVSILPKSALTTHDLARDPRN
jgi:hypothetical protein